jgi:hypothetical protein
MNPNTPHQSFELPSPQRINGAETVGEPAENPAARQETSSQPLLPPIQQIPAQPLQPPSLQQSTVHTMQNSQGVAASSNPVIANDNDLIEKEWVTKAKQIVAATREDPHEQNKEISRFKADYLKKRYNKDIKIEEH